MSINEMDMPPVTDVCSLHALVAPQHQQLGGPALCVVVGLRDGRCVEEGLQSLCHEDS